jgi:translation initiation factor RLI1
MKVKLIIAVITFTLLNSCNDSRKNPTTDIDVARSFIKDLLENDFNSAKEFLLDEEANNQYFELSKKEFEGKSKEVLKKYKESDIIVNELTPVNDSVSIVNYSNSFNKEKKYLLKVVRQNGKWWVDLKYTFQQPPN